jgi:SmpA / OmlA family
MIVCALWTLLLAVHPAGVRAEEPGLIEPGVGIGRVKLGDTKEQMLAVMGSPLMIGETLGEPKKYNYQYHRNHRQDLYINVYQNKVELIMCLSPDYHLKSGLGVGSSLNEFEAQSGESYQRKEGSVGPELLYPSGLRVIFYEGRAMGLEVRPAKK